MSPIPPPPGTFVHSDDWTDDPSFDLSPSASHFALPSSPSASSSSSSRNSLASIRKHASSPLRQVFASSIPLPPTPQKAPADGEDEDAGFDLPDSFPAFSSPRTSLAHVPRTTSTGSTGSMSSLSKMVVGTGPKGVGTITKLGSTPSKTSLPSGTVKARAKALEAAWEADLDFDDVPSLPLSLPSHKTSATPDEGSGGRGTIRKLKFSPSKVPRMPPPDALDDLGFDDLEDEDQATLKAGATIKALLPPPKPRIPPTKKEPTPPTQDDAEGLEDDFVLPLNLTNLSLVPSQPARRSKPRESGASTTAPDWDSPGTSTSGRKSIGGSGFRWESDSPRGKGRHSETSVTSMSDRSTPAKAFFPVTPTSHHAGAGTEDMMLDDEEENMEDGLLLPSPTFFSTTRTKDLNAILDKKRKPQFAAPLGPVHRRSDTADTWRTGDESIEDGLVFNDPRVELSNSRLRNGKKARNLNTGTYPPKGARGKVQAAKDRERALDREREKEKAREKSREQGWGRHTPLPSVHGTPRERTQSTLVLPGHRSHSASGARIDSPPGPSARDLPRTTSATATGTPSGRMLPPPPPIPSTPSGNRGLRHQKSHFHLPHHTPLQSPGLARKQSLASLQDALSHPAKAEAAEEMTPVPALPQRYHNSTSRLTMPTSSSRAKIRPPITSVFPRADITPSNSSRDNLSGLSGLSGFAGLAAGHGHSAGGGGGKRAVEMQIPKRSKHWGNGTELEGIEDLDVGDVSARGLGLGRPSKRDHESRGGTATPRADPSVRKKSGHAPAPTAGATGSLKRTKGRKPAALIRNMTSNDRKRVVGEMTWNPSTLRWEGNETILRDFEHIPTSTSARPALITHYTSSGVTSPTSGGAGAGSTIRIVGDMKFDPARMCWVNLNAEDEVDPFEGMADDEDEDLGGTITRSAGRKLVSVGLSSATTGTNWSSRLASEASSLATSIASGTSAASGNSAGIGMAGGSGGAQYIGEGSVTADLYKECKEAEERHRRDVKGWVGRMPTTTAEMRERDRREEKRLWEIRNLAMKS